MLKAAATQHAGSPLVSREVRAAAFSASLRRSLVARDVSHAALAHALGMSRQRLDQIADPEHPAGLRAADIEDLPAAVLRDVLGPVLERAGLALVALPGAMDATSAKAAAQFVREAGAAAAEILEAHADGVLTPAEGAEVERAIDTAIGAGLTVREHAREAQRVPVRRIGERLAEGIQPRRMVPRRPA